MFSVQMSTLFEKYILVMFFIILLLLLQFGPNRPLIPFPDSARLFIVFGIGVLALFASVNRLRILSLGQSVAIAWLFLLFLWALVTTFSGGEYAADSARRVFLAIGGSLLVMLSVFTLRPEPEFAWALAKVFTAVATAVSVVGLMMSLWGGPYIASGTGTYFQIWNVGVFQLTHEIHSSGGFRRISSVTANPNTLGFFAGLACLLVAIRFVTGRCGMFFSLILFSLNLAALLHSFSRGSILALFVALAVVILFSITRRVILYVLGLLVMVLMLAPVYMGSLAAMVEARAEKGLEGREEIWVNAIDVFKARPLMGVGFGLEKERIHEPAGIKSTMHNAYLVVLVETGIVGFVFFSFFLATILYLLLVGVTRSGRPEERAVLLLVLGIAVFFLTRSIVETSIMRFTNVNFVFVMFVAVGLAVAGGRSRPVT